MGESNTKQGNRSSHVRPIITVAVVSLLLCGILFPLVVTGVAQLVFPYQANGELASLNGHAVGSVIAVNSTDYTLPVFFHLRNDSASGFDPDITLQDAQSQIPGISKATGIPATTLQGIVNQNIEGVWWIFGSPYMNVQKVNLLLIGDFPRLYANYTA
ncbi:MAG TPA: potassium-transporting ATPase subunit C [Nitrososphaerales archaeon]|nr:potassium-transporting ATPase subunit C [Nitrososphaerales archaeon]